jgi:hypothetical protein
VRTTTLYDQLLDSNAKSGSRYDIQAASVELPDQKYGFVLIHWTESKFSLANNTASPEVKTTDSKDSKVTKSTSNESSSPPSIPSWIAFSLEEESEILAQEQWLVNYSMSILRLLSLSFGVVPCKSFF